MSYLELIIPFAIPPAAHAKDLLRQLHMPAFERLCGFSRLREQKKFEDWDAALPHERWLFPSAAAQSPANTHNRMHTLGLVFEEGYWLSLHPVHIHIARDHLVLTDFRRLAIKEEEARALFDVAQDCCAEFGKTLLWGDNNNWFLRADTWQDLQTASQDAACGHAIDIWMPKGESAREWRKLQNEIQMLWHGHPLNHAREEQGLRTINSLWIDSGSTQVLDSTAARPALDASEGFAALASRLQDHNGVKPKRIYFPQLIESALNNDWGLWLQEMQKLETNTFAVIERIMLSKEVKHVDLILSDAQQIITLELQAKKFWSFWRKPSLQKIL